MEPLILLMFCVIYITFETGKNQIVELAQKKKHVNCIYWVYISRIITHLLKYHL